MPCHAILIINYQLLISMALKMVEADQVPLIVCKNSMLTTYFVGTGPSLYWEVRYTEKILQGHPYERFR